MTQGLPFIPLKFYSDLPPIPSDVFLEEAVVVLKRRGYETVLHASSLRFVGGDSLAIGEISTAIYALRTGRKEASVTLEILSDLGLTARVVGRYLVAS